MMPPTFAGPPARNYAQNLTMVHICMPFGHAEPVADGETRRACRAFRGNATGANQFMDSEVGTVALRAMAQTGSGT